MPGLYLQLVNSALYAILFDFLYNHIYSFFSYGISLFCLFHTLLERVNAMRARVCLALLWSHSVLMYTITNKIHATTPIKTRFLAILERFCSIFEKFLTQPPSIICLCKGATQIWGYLFYSFCCRIYRFEGNTKI